ncbi:MAG TPA: DNA-binding protein [Candidatus Avidehalobacter gallistercoris]|uniref:DNA-binding protein n=1 Tax=Candidatus Avidehalobacter gallistercoris TaxID=2840694 RepID=A0A9D1HIA7_9FIRM|nr:DNA-binding protein [Candidatus Avidehalobacter gallistercoris]
MAKGIKSAMEAKRIGIDVIAAVLGIHRNSASNKVNGVTQFTVEEAFKLKAELFPEYDSDYLYTDLPN